MGWAWASGGMSHGWVTTVYVHIKLKLSKSKRRHSGSSTANHSRWSVLLCCNVISHRGSTANWLVLVSCNLQSLSSKFSTASLYLIHCNLISLSEVSFPFFHILFCCKVACLSLAVWVARLVRSLTLSFSTFCSFGPLSLQYVGLRLFVHHHRSSCSCADWASLGELKWRALEYDLYAIVFDISPARIGVRNISG